MDTATLVQRYWDRMNDNDWAAAADLFSGGFTLVWPQSGETIRSKESFVAINTHFPSRAAGASQSENSWQQVQVP